MSPRPKLLLSLATLMVLAMLPDVSFAQKGGGKTTTPRLSLTISPSTILEGNTATGTVTHNNSSTSSAVTVTLGSSDTSEATVPASVTIAAGTNSATFTVTALNDGTVDGNQLVTISASATGYTAGSSSITVSDKPTFEYRTEVIPVGNYGAPWVNGITNNSRVYGWVSDGNGYKSGFVYDQASGVMYDFNQIPALTTQVHNLAGPDVSFSSVVGMNESGLMTGSLIRRIDPSTTNTLGFAIDSTVNGQFSPDPADWVVQLLPDFDSIYFAGRRINEFGDILAPFQRADRTWGVYLYNPWLGGTPAAMPNGATELNDLAQVAGVDASGNAFIYDSVSDSIQIFTDADYERVDGLTNAGVFAGLVSVTTSSRNKLTTTPTVFRHDGTTIQLIGTSDPVAFSFQLNQAGDVAFLNSNSYSWLSHTGFAPDYEERKFSLSTAIAADDPFKSIQAWRNYAINDRDETGYSQLVCGMAVPDGSRGTTNVVVILTPYPVP